MLQKGNRVDFVGFSPDAEQKWLIEAEVTKLLDRAPGQSLLTGVICSEAEGYSAKIIIDAFSHHFHAYSTSDDLYGLMNKIDAQLSTQFLQWKEGRFRPQTV